jgi:hypothetical protein
MIRSIELDMTTDLSPYSLSLLLNLTTWDSSDDLYAGARRATED